MIQIEIPIPQKVSTNAIYAGMHWGKRKKIADVYHQSLLEHRKLRVTDFPVEITFIFSFRKKPLDTSNCSFMAKCLEDALVQNEILPNDTIDFVSSITSSAKKAAKIKLRLWLCSCGKLNLQSMI